MRCELKRCRSVMIFGIKNWVQDNWVSGGTWEDPTYTGGSRFGDQQKIEQKGSWYIVGQGGDVFWNLHLTMVKS